MFPRHRVSGMALCLALLPGTQAAGEPGSPRAATGPAQGPAAAVDRHGDPLPALAVARLGTVRWRESGNVAISPDGKVVASCGAVGLGLWEVPTGKRVPWFSGGFQAEAVVFPPDGKTLITARRGGPGEALRDPRKVQQIIERWELGTGRLLGQVSIDRSADRSPGFQEVVALSADGRLLVASTGRNEIRGWDTRSGKLVFDLKQVREYPAPFSLSADGKTLATVRKDLQLALYDTATGKELHHFPVRGETPTWRGFYAPALSPDGKTLVASTPTSLCVWDAADGKLRGEIPGGQGPVAFSADGKYLASGDRKDIRLREVDSLREVRRFEGRHDRIVPLAFSADGRLLVSAQGQRLGLWDAATGKQLNPSPAHDGVVYSLAFAPDGTALASGGSDGAACVWALPGGELRHRFDGHHLAAVSLAFSPDGRTLATGDGLSGGKDGREAQIRLWGLVDGRLIRQFTGHLNGVGALAYSPDGRRLASGGGDARARVWDPATGKRLFQIRGAEGQRSVGFSPDGKVLLVGDTGGELALWRADTGEKVRDLGTAGDPRRHIVHATFLRDGKAVVSEEQGNPPQLRFWDAASGQETHSAPLRVSYPFYSAVSPDGALAAAVAEDHLGPAIQLRDTSSGEILVLLRGHSGFIMALAFSPDGKVLASGSRDTTVLLWDVGQARLVGLWFQLAGEPVAAARAGKRLAANPAGTVPFLRERLRRAAALEAPYARLIAELDDDRFEVRERASRRLLGDAGAEFALRLALQGRPSAELRRRAENVLGKLAAAREERIGRLIADLAGARSSEASRRLHELGEAAEPALRRALQPSPFPGRADEREDASQRVRWRAQQILSRLKEPDSSSLPLNPQAVVRAVAVLEEVGTPEARQALEELAGGAAQARVTREAKAALERLKGRDKSPGRK